MSTATIAAPAPAAGPGQAPAGADKRRAFEDLYANFYAATRSWVLRKVGDWDLAEELAQNTFVHLWDKTLAGAADPASIRAPQAWVRGWARMQILQHFNTPAARQEYTTAPDDLLFTRWLAAPGVDPARQAGDRVDVSRLLADVPDTARQVLALHYLHDLTVPEVAEATGVTQVQAATLITEGLDHVRDLLGIAPDQVTTRARADQDADLRWRLKTLAGARLGRQPQFRQAVATAIADGVYPPGTSMPSTSVLTERHAPPEPTLRNHDASTAANVLASLTRRGILTGNPATGYTVTHAAPRLAAEHVEPVPADQALARELLNGGLGPGDLLPRNEELTRRWHAARPTITAVLDQFTQMGALVRTPGGRYYVTPEPGTDFTPDPAAELSARLPDADVLAAVLAEHAATGHLPTAKQIKATYRTGSQRAATIRTAAAQAAGVRLRAVRKPATATATAAAAASPATQAPPAETAPAAQFAADAVDDLSAAADLDSHDTAPATLAAADPSTVQDAPETDHGHDTALHELDLDDALSL
jgi:RNA polymerase sigma factor (sigma-70 family)